MYAEVKPSYFISHKLGSQMSLPQTRDDLFCLKGKTLRTGG
jgi:hypothetical protein